MNEMPMCKTRGIYAVAHGVKQLLKIQGIMGSSPGSAKEIASFLNDQPPDCSGRVQSKETAIERGDSGPRFSFGLRCPLHLNLSSFSPYNLKIRRLLIISKFHWQDPSLSTESSRGEKPSAFFSVLGVAGSSLGGTSYPNTAD